MYFLGYDTVFRDFQTHIFQRHLKLSRHQPLCVVFRNESEYKFHQCNLVFWNTYRNNPNVL